MSEATVQMKPRGGMLKKVLLWGVGIFVLLGVLGAIFGDESSKTAATADTGSTSDAPAQVAALSVTASELSKAYEDNEVAAQKTYGGKPVEISGTISGVTLDAFDNPVVQLAGSNQFMPVQVSFDKAAADKIATLKKGQTFKARCGGVTEVISMPMLNDCTF